MSRSDRGVAFVYSAMGSQWSAMGVRLMAESSAFASMIDAIDSVFQPLAGWSMRVLLSSTINEERLSRPAIAFPAVCALQIALTELWRQAGVRPSALAGHSIGEIAAAHAAGALGLETAMEIAYHYGRVAEQGVGAMAALRASCAEAESLLEIDASDVAIAAVNSPCSVTLSGEATALERVVERAERKALKVRPLNVGRGIHSPCMDLPARELRDVLSHLPRCVTGAPLYSSVGGKQSKPATFDAQHWADSLRGPVLFGDAIGAMARDGASVFVEVGPAMSVLGYVRQVVGAEKFCGWPSMNKQRDPFEMMSKALTGLKKRQPFNSRPEVFSREEPGS